MTSQAQRQLAIVFLVGILTPLAQSQQRLIDILRVNPDQVSKISETAADPEAQIVLDGREPSFERFLMAFLLAKQSRTRFVAQVETARTDKQMGASSSGSGSLNVVDRPGIAEILGFGLQHGAITQNVTGNTLTLSTSPYMLIASIQHADTAETYSNYGDTYGRLALSATFNLTDQTNPLTSATRKQLNQWSADFRLLGDHSGRSKAALRAFKGSKLNQTMQAEADKETEILSTIFANNDNPLTAMRTDSELRALISQLRDNPPSTDEAKKQAKQDLSAKLVAAFVKHVAEITVAAADRTSLDKAIEDYRKAAAEHMTDSTDFDDLLLSLQKQMSLTLEYNQQQPTTGSNYSVVKLLLEKQPCNFLQLTANLNSSFYHHPDATKNQQTFRGASAALEVMQKLGRSPFLSDTADRSPITLSFSGRYERLPENSGMPKKKADIAVAGAKLEIPIAAGMSFPISVTYANSTELIKEAHVQGNFGFTFDLDKLNALIHK